MVHKPTFAPPCTIQFVFHRLRGSKGRETGQGDGDLGQGGSGGGDEMWAESRHILKVEPIALLMGLDVGKRARKESRQTARLLVLGSERTGFP